ncbi:NUDIX hydrolase [Pontibacter pamirensis]|uniref:NUDIX hydrolase n=1 Tax=Pontibacter pamirensis TaxID=2562824 RepID=UPI001389EE2A|nr:NUDIX domain-containing protein [Pontibacter pamirensis]
MEEEVENILQHGEELFHPGLSVDCVIFGFHDNQLKVLLLKMKHADKWALPGGFVYKEEEVEHAAVRVLQSRTGLGNIFLRQFHTFGSPSRSDRQLNKELLVSLGLEARENHWFLQRFITVGYYALVNFSSAVPRPDVTSEACAWWDLQDMPTLVMDHVHILQQALETLRKQLNDQPIGYNLLPEKFTMPELQRLYETILGRQLDRRNFQRKMLGYGILDRLEERKRGVAHKAPYLYSFDKEKYAAALQDGLQQGW